METFYADPHSGKPNRLGDVNVRGRRRRFPRALPLGLSSSPWLQEELGKSRVWVSSSLANMAGARNPNLELGFRSISSILFLLLLASFPLRSESSCRRGCDLAIGSYYVSSSSDNLTYISSLFNLNQDDVLPYNPNISNKDSIHIDSRINISFSSCDCLPDGSSLGLMFSYLTPTGVTYTSIASTVYANLTNVTDLETFNSYPPNNIPNNVDINVTVRCFCGDADVSREYGLFVTYPLRPGENLSTVAAEWGFRGQEDLLQRYNQGMNFSAGEGIVFIPTKGQIFIQFGYFLNGKDRIFGFWNCFCDQNPCISLLCATSFG